MVTDLRVTSRELAWLPEKLPSRQLADFAAPRPHPAGPYEKKNMRESPGPAALRAAGPVGR